MEILKDINWIGVTGTNGKTTVTHLLSHILCDAGLHAPFAGNIGTPLCKYAYSKKHEKIDWVVAELSSYQIEISPEVKPNIGIWTTFTDCLLYTSPSPRDRTRSRMPSSA